MRIVINAQLDPAQSGGIAQVLVGLAHGLGQLIHEPSDQFIFVCSPASADWLRPFLGARQELTVNSLPPKPVLTGGVRESDGFWESFRPDVLHFPYQAFTRTAIPTVFNPHDLQHVHLPELFTRYERERREDLYGQACRLAAAVAVASNWVKDDVIRQYDLTSKNVQVIPWAAPTKAYVSPQPGDIQKVLGRFELEPGFAIYPAQTWPHKNHLRLLEAIDLVRRRTRINIRLVCTGAPTDHQTIIERRSRSLDLTRQVRFLGRVDESDLMALYRAARFMIVPTLFEAQSFPVFEAFAEGLPVACSHVTSLPEQVDDAALLFNPHDIDAIADTMVTLQTDDAQRENLVKRGHTRLRDFSWLATAAAYRELYRRVATSSPRPSRPTSVGK